MELNGFYPKPNEGESFEDYKDRMSADYPSLLDNDDIQYVLHNIWLSYNPPHPQLGEE